MFFFIRHNKLEPPFDDYNKLKFQDLIDLSNQSINPMISNNYKNNDLLRKISNTKIDFIYTSKINRTKETAKILWYNNFIEIKELNEIIFDINKLINFEEYKQFWLGVVREKLWKNLFLKKDWVENIKNLEIRLEKITEIIRNNNKKNILFISHWFLIILIYIKIFKNKSLLEISYDEFISLNIQPIDYLNWFYIQSLS